MSADKGFFEDVLPDEEGWVPILNRDNAGRLTNFRWFIWPTEKGDMADYIESISGGDVYFSPMLFAAPPTRSSATWARKGNVTRVAVVTADGDDMDIAKLRVPPTTVVQTSRNHWQGYWRFIDSEDGDLSNFDFEDLSHGLYDAHADDGMDRGWPLAVKRRVPFTMNTKPEYGLPYEVSYETDHSVAVTAAEFGAEYPPAETIDLSEIDVIPDVDPNDVIEILARVNSPVANDLFIDTPPLGSDWSSRVYRLECILFEAGVSVEDVFAVVSEAACNKFKRDERSESDLWVQVNRDRGRWEHTTNYTEVDTEEFRPDDVALPTLSDADRNGLFWGQVSLLDDEERSNVPDNTFLDVFTTWAQSRSPQTPWEFNVAGACVLLSGTLARYAKLPLSFGDMPLNLYFMVLGRTTQSRKSTSLRLAKSILRDVSPEPDPADEVDGPVVDEYVVPDDATPEALTEFLNGRPRRSSIYAVDEWQDTLAATARKGSYLSGLIPFLTKAYDGIIPGVLRKTSGNRYQRGVDHYLSFYATGIFDQAAEALTIEKIASGFVPRTLIVVDSREGFTPGADDVRFLDETAVKRTDSIRRILASKLQSAITHWDEQYAARLMVAQPNEDPRYSLACDDETFVRWQRFAYEVGLLAANHPTNPKALFPMCERMSFSVLKVAGLLALVEQSSEIRMRHLLKAIAVADTWVHCAEALVAEVVSNGFARDVREVEDWVRAQPSGAVRYEHLLTKFQNRFDSGAQLRSVIEFCTQKGTLRDVITNPKTRERVIQYVGK